MSMIDREEEFTFCLYINTPSGVVPSHFTRSTTSTSSSPSVMEPLPMVMAVIVALGLLLYMLESDDSALSYSPQRVLRQMARIKARCWTLEITGVAWHVTRRLGSSRGVRT